MIITKILDEGNRSGRHFMKGYPYKRNFPFKPNTTHNHISKKEDVSLHEFACDYHLFKKLLRVIWTIVLKI